MVIASRASDIRPDATDVRIMNLLVGDGRMSNRDLATEVGLTEATIASRIKNLTERRVFRVGALVDWSAAGYQFGATIMLGVETGELAAVGHVLSDLPLVYFVGAVFGSADLVVSALVTDHHDVGRLTDQISSIDGVNRMIVNTTFATAKYHYRYAMLGRPPAVVEFPAPCLSLDELDRSIIAALVDDGRTSNRELGRKLGYAEGTVRARLRRLEESGLLHIRAQMDPFLAHELGSLAYVGIEVEGSHVASAIDSLVAMPTVLSLSRSTGRHQLLAAVGAAERSMLVGAVMNDLQSLPGIRSTETWEFVDFVKMSSYLVRFV